MARKKSNPAKTKAAAAKRKLPHHSSAPIWCWSHVHDGMDRIHLIPRNRFVNIYIHRFNGPDPDRGLHDHPWWSASLLLYGMLIEERDVKSPRKLAAPRFYIRSPRLAHRIIDGSWPERRPLTLFITGPVVRQWGFHTRAGWVHHDDFLDTK